MFESEALCGLLIWPYIISIKSSFPLVVLALAPLPLSLPAVRWLIRPVFKIAYNILLKVSNQISSHLSSPQAQQAWHCLCLFQLQAFFVYWLLLSTFSFPRSWIEKSNARSLGAADFQIPEQVIFQEQFHYVIMLWSLTGFSQGTHSS